MDCPQPDENEHYDLPQPRSETLSNCNANLFDKSQTCRASEWHSHVAVLPNYKEEWIRT